MPMPIVRAVPPGPCTVICMPSCTTSRLSARSVMRTGCGCGSGCHAALKPVALRGDQVRAAQQAVVGDRRGAARELQRRHLPHALADRGVDQVARIPLLLDELGLGRGRRQDAFDLAGQVDAGRLAEAVLRQVGIEAFDAHVQREPVVVGVDRIGDRLARIGPAVAAAYASRPSRGRACRAGGTRRSTGSCPRACARRCRGRPAPAAA